MIERKVLEGVSSGYTLDDLMPQAPCVVCEIPTNFVLLQHQYANQDVVVPLKDIPANRCDSEECAGRVWIPPQVALDLYRRVTRRLLVHGYIGLANRLNQRTLNMEQHFAPSARLLIKPGRLPQPIT